MRYLISMNSVHLILEILKYKLMKRLYFICDLFYDKDIELSINVFKNYIINKHKLENMILINYYNINVIIF